MIHGLCFPHILYQVGRIDQIDQIFQINQIDQIDQSKYVHDLRDL